MRLSPLPSTLSLLLLCGLTHAHAAESAAVATPHAQVTLVSDQTAVEAGKPFKLGLRFRLAKGWHIYWINPGAAGEPPHLDLTLPRGAKASAIAWPTPERVREGSAMTYSYLGDILLPLTVTPPPDATAMPITAKASWLVCADICVPEEGSLRLDLPVGAPSPSPQVPLFAAAGARIPKPSPYAARLGADATLSLTGAGLSPATVRDAWFLPRTPDVIDDAAPQTLSVSDGGLKLSLKPAKAFDPKAGVAGVLVLKSPTGAETDLAVAAPADGAASPTAKPPPSTVTVTAVTPPAAADLGLATMLAFAFLGGLILNLMPCVFPILAIKAVGIARLSGRARGEVRAHAVSYTLGVLLGFLALGGVVLALRQAGMAAGWGFQFQSPVFVAAMAFLLFMVGLNLSGVFEVGGGLTGTGDALAARSGHVGSFFTGLLAVLAATPCTAPFMGAAVAAAIAAPAGVLLAVFAALGLGLATPYALLAIVPALAGLLPRPGAWMIVLKQVLAFPMYAAAAWLVWVVSQQAGPEGVLASLAGLVLLGFAAWLVGATQGRSGHAPWLGRGFAALAVACALLTLREVSQPLPPASASASSDAYSPARLSSLRSQGRPVFVNMTAAWCVTCLVNERVALSSEAVRNAFAARDVTYLKGDWTRADPAISAFLREHGRDGVPLYVLYPPKGEPPVILPQILTASAVVEAIERFGG